MTNHDKHDREAEENIKRIVDQYGWFVAMIPATAYQPSFAYTIGLWKNYNHPELISFGLTSETLHSILNTGGEIAKEGGRIAPNKSNSDFFDQSDAFILEVDKRNLADYFGYGIWYNKGSFKALQIVWTDRNGKFPWEEGFEERFSNTQPLLDRNFDFKFKEPKNLGVYTNRYYLELGKPILYVEHDFNGDWQFLTGDDLTNEDAKIMALCEIVEKDKSLNALFNLDYGEYAERKSINDAWIRGKLEENDQ